MDVRLQDLTKRYPSVVAVDVPALAIPEGERFGLVGNNGAGKTTLLRLMLDLIRPTTGGVWIGGERAGREAGWKARTAAYLDEGFLIDFLTPEEYLHFVGESYGLSEAQVEQAVASHASLFTDPVLGGRRYIRELSTGNRKKVGLVAAMMVRPALLILDEPFANLDPSSQIGLKGALHRLHAERGTTMVISSHDLKHVTEICDRIVLIEAGRIAADARTSEHTLPTLERHFARQVG